MANSGRRLILQIKLQIQEEISVDLIFSPFTQSITDGGAICETVVKSVPLLRNDHLGNSGIK